jgi:hypothetical protein
MQTALARSWPPTTRASPGPGKLTPGAIIPISTATNTAGTPIRVRGMSGEVAITPDGKTVYVAGMNTVTPINTATGRPGTPIYIGTAAGPTWADVFTHATLVEPASLPVRCWYRTRMGFPVCTENSVIVKPNTLGWADAWKNGATSLVPSPVMSGTPMMRWLALPCCQPTSLPGTGIRVLEASRLPAGAAVSSRRSCPGVFPFL